MCCQSAGSKRALQFDLNQSQQNVSLFLTQLDVVPKVGMTGPRGQRRVTARAQPFDEVGADVGPRARAAGPG